MKATAIKMISGCYASNDLQEIDEIYLEGCQQDGFYKKAAIYDFLVQHPHTIFVNIAPCPYLEPVISKNGEKYVRSEANANGFDNLLSLPRK